MALSVFVISGHLVVGSTPTTGPGLGRSERVTYGPRADMDYSGKPAERRDFENASQYELGESIPNGTRAFNRESEKPGSIRRSSWTISAARSRCPVMTKANARCRNAGAKRLFCTSAFSAQVTASPYLPSYVHAIAMPVDMNHSRGSRGLNRRARPMSSKLLAGFPTASTQPAIAKAMAEFGFTCNER